MELSVTNQLLAVLVVATCSTLGLIYGVIVCVTKSKSKRRQKFTPLPTEGSRVTLSHVPPSELLGRITELELQQESDGATLKASTISQPAGLKTHDWKFQLGDKTSGPQKKHKKSKGKAPGPPGVTLTKITHIGDLPDDHSSIITISEDTHTDPDYQTLHKIEKLENTKRKYHIAQNEDASALPDDMNVKPPIGFGNCHLQIGEPVYALINKSRTTTVTSTSSCDPRDGMKQPSTEEDDEVFQEPIYQELSTCVTMRGKSLSGLHGSIRNTESPCPIPPPAPKRTRESYKEVYQDEVLKEVDIIVDHERTEDSLPRFLSIHEPSHVNGAFEAEPDSESGDEQPYGTVYPEPTRSLTQEIPKQEIPKQETLKQETSPSQEDELYGQIWMINKDNDSGHSPKPIHKGFHIEDDERQVLELEHKQKDSVILESKVSSEKPKPSPEDTWTPEPPITNGHANAGVNEITLEPEVAKVSVLQRIKMFTVVESDSEDEMPPPKRPARKPKVPLRPPPPTISLTSTPRPVAVVQKQKFIPTPVNPEPGKFAMTEDEFIEDIDKFYEATAGLSETHFCELCANDVFHVHKKVQPLRVITRTVTIQH